METLEDIISELNPSCRIGEYRDRILATSDPPAIDELIEKYERIVEKAEIPVNFGVYSNFLKDLKELGDILCMDIHPDSTIGQWLKRNIKDKAPSDSNPIELLKEIIDILTDIQGSYKGSIGSIRNTYMAQLEVKKIDSIEVKIREYIKNHTRNITFLSGQYELVFKTS